MTNNQKATLN